MSKPGKVLKALCKKLGIRLTVKRGQKRVYKSVAVLKRQCANKKKKSKKVKRKKKVKRRRRFGSGIYPSSSYKYDAYIQGLSRYLNEMYLKGTLKSPAWMAKMIIPYLEEDKYFGEKNIDYLIHNNFFKNNWWKPSTKGISSFMLSYYHKFVPFEMKNVGEEMMRDVRSNERGPPKDPLSLEKARRYIFKQNKVFDINFSSLTGKFTRIECRRRRLNYDNKNPTIKIDQIIHELMVMDIRGFKRFYSNHKRRYSLLKPSELPNGIEIRNNEPYIVSPNGNYLNINKFLKRILQEFIILRHKLRVLCLPEMDPLVHYKDFKFKVHFCNKKLKICTCKDFLRNFSYENGKDIIMKPPEQRTCKHIIRRDKIKYDENEKLYHSIDRLPGEDNMSPLEQFYNNISRLRTSFFMKMSNRPESHNTRLHGVPGVIHPDDETDETVRNRFFPGLPLENPKDIIKKNVKLSEPDQQCLGCREEVNFLFKNCPRNCNDARICIKCIKNPDLDESQLLECWICKKKLKREQFDDILNLRFFTDVEDFNEIAAETLLPKLFEYGKRKRKKVKKKRKSKKVKRKSKKVKRKRKRKK